MKRKNDAPVEQAANDNDPYMVCGSGPIVSFVYKVNDHRPTHRYEFNVFRANRQTGEVTQLFGPADVMHLTKLSKVLAKQLAQQECLPSTLRDDLACLASCLEDVLGNPHPAPAKKATGSDDGTKH
jgi:hypothetical protein